ncbi:beta strand repeat-containing protein, partial [Tenacibaculum sp. MEBiC07804]|uniref:beta strand repeat-containing protein n=1 Tax=Tenacibaculum sp. MEBiC07804 TaxID=3412025 RepID=UPI003BA810C0
MTIKNITVMLFFSLLFGQYAYSLDKTNPKRLSKKTLVKSSTSYNDHYIYNNTFTKQNSNNSTSFLKRLISNPFAVTSVDLNGDGAGVDANITSEPTSGSVGPIIEFGTTITTDTGNIISASLTFSGVADGSNELIGLFDGGGAFVGVFDLSTTNATLNATYGGNTLVISNPSPGVFNIVDSVGGVIPTANFISFLSFFQYGNQLGAGGATEGIRTVAVSVTEDGTGATGSANSFINVQYFPNAVDDSNSIIANSVTPVTGDLEANDTDLTVGDVLSISEVNGFSGAVGSAFVTTYGTITVQSNGNYSYTVDTNNITVRGLQSGSSLTDIISYAVQDINGNTDYGFIVITINGVDELPVATDNTNEVTVSTSPSASGNVIFDDDGFGQDSGDRLLSQLIWENEFTNGQVVNGLSRTISGVTLDFTSADPDGIGTALNQIALTTSTNGGHTGYLLFNTDPSTNPNTATTLTVDFSEPVVGLSFTITDIDYSQGDTWQDQMTVTGNLGGTNIVYTPQVPGSVVQVGADTFYGTGSVPPEDAHGNVNFFFDQPVDQVVLSYNYGPDATILDLGNQIAGVTDFNWQSTAVPRIYQVNGSTLNVGVLTPTTYGFITLNGDGTYTYTLDPANLDVINLLVGNTLTDTIPYVLIDSLDASGNTDSANLIITINGSAVDDTATVAEDDSVVIDILANDPNVPTDGSLTIISAPSNGTVTINDGGNADPNDDIVTYIPNLEFNGTDTFSYEVCDNATPANCSSATVTITVTPVNDTPTANDDTATVTENGTVSITVSGNDSVGGDGGDGDDFSLTTSPSNGTVTETSDGVFLYTPNTSFNGTDSFTYTITDVDGDTDTATVSITINACLIEAGLIVNEASNGSSGSEDWVELLVVGDPSNPTTNVDLTGWIFDDNNGDFEGSTTGVGIASGYIVFGSAFNSVPPGSLIVIYNNASGAKDPNIGPDDPTDSNGDGVYILPGNHSSLSGCSSNPTSSDPSYVPCTTPTTSTWSRTAFRNGGDAAQTRKPDGTFYHGFAYGDVTAPFPTFPCGGSSFNLGAGGTGSTFAFQCGDWEDSGNFVRSGSSGRTPGYANSDENQSFIDRLSDGSVDYSNLNDASNCLLVSTPTANDDYASLDEDTNVSITVSANDYLGGDGGDGEDYSLTTGPTNGSVTETSDGVFSYTPNADFNGTDSFTYTITDADGDTDTAT